MLNSGLRMANDILHIKKKIMIKTFCIIQWNFLNCHKEYVFSSRPKMYTLASINIEIEYS